MSKKLGIQIPTLTNQIPITDINVGKYLMDMYLTG